MGAKPGPSMQDPKPKAVLQFVREYDYPFVTTSDVSEEFQGVTPRTIRNRLNWLCEEGKLEKYEVGANSVVWYLPEEDDHSNSSASRSFPASESQ